MIVRPITTRIFKEGEALAPFIRAHIPRLKEGSVLVVTSKIVALSEGRTVVARTKAQKERVIQEESEIAIPTKYVWLSIVDGTMVSSAGIDESNANGKLILLPRDSFESAKRLWKALRKSYRLKRFGVLITDSRTFPLRAGAVGMAMGYAGMSAIKDYRGTPDLFGRRFTFSRANIADGIAAAAVVTMGEGRERRPLAVVEGVEGVRFTNRVDRTEIKIPLSEDMYRPLFQGIRSKKRRRR